jgi:isopenicillin-N epimerase
MSHLRRDFLRHLAGLAVVPASWPVLTNALNATGQADGTTETYWKLVSQQFPLEPKLIYLNAANICPSSRPVLDRHLELLRDFHANPSFQNRDKYRPMYEQLRSKLAAMLGAFSADEIAITRNTSEANNMLVTGVVLKPGEEVIITTHNHESNGIAWIHRAKREGFTVKSVPVTVPARSRDDIIAGFEQAITPQTRVIALSHVTHTTGILYPVREVVELARKRNIWVHVDGAQTFGVLDVNLRALGCDSYSASAHKWLTGPLEAGVLYVRAERLPQIWPSIVTAGWSYELEGARKLDMLGQRDDPRIAAFEAAVDFMQLIGIRNVEARSRALALRIMNQLDKIPSVHLKTNVEEDLSAAVVRFTLRNRPTQEAYDRLFQEHRIALAMTASGDAEGLRFAPHIYNSFEDVDRAVAAVRSLVG